MTRRCTTGPPEPPKPPPKERTTASSTIAAMTISRTSMTTPFNGSYAATDVPGRRFRETAAGSVRGGGRASRSRAAELSHIRSGQLRVLEWWLLDGAEGAAAGVVRDRAPALRTVLGALTGVGLGLEPLHEGVHRKHDEVVERETDQCQREHLVDEIAVVELRPVQLEELLGEVFVVAQRDVDEWREEVVDEPVDD